MLRQEQAANPQTEGARIMRYLLFLLEKWTTDHQNRSINQLNVTSNVGSVSDL